MMMQEQVFFGVGGGGVRGLEGPKWNGGAGPDDTTRVDWLLRRTVEPWVQWMRAHCEDRISESNMKLRREFC